MADNGYVIIGGTFDPVHNGHILLGEALYKIFHQVITFIPAAPPNYKAPSQTSALNRLEMLNLAVGNDQRFSIDTSEIFSQRYIPTINSLEMLRKKIGDNVPVYFFIGEDSLVSLDTWDNWHKLFDLTNFIVAMRPGYSLNQMSKQLQYEYTKRVTHNITELTKPYGQIYVLDFKPVNISSTMIRSHVAQNQPIDDLVNPKIAQYIAENKLYLSNKLC